MKRKAYAVVTNDKYELPLGIFDTRDAVAVYLGVTSNGISTRIRRQPKSDKAKVKILKLLI
jgi:hypothetical protein